MGSGPSLKAWAMHDDRNLQFVNAIRYYPRWLRHDAALLGQRNPRRLLLERFTLVGLFERG